MDIVLLGGLWLDAAAWDDVVPGLEAAGHRPVVVTLPGQGDGRSEATLEDQVQAVLTAVSRAQQPVLLVGHSAASTLAWLVADRAPEAVARVAMIGGMPNADGEAYFDGLKATDGQLAFPGWEPFAGPDSDDLSDEIKQRVAQRAIPVPEGVLTGVVHYTSPRRLQVPLTMICPEYSPADVQDWLTDGHLPELAQVEHVDYVDLDSGHWPMFSRPAELAEALAGIADRTEAVHHG